MRKCFKIYILIIFYLFFISAHSAITSADDFSEDEPFVEALSNSDNVLIEPKIEARNAVVIDMKSGRILFQKNAFSRASIASTTKIMTAIVAIENGNLDDIITVSKKASGVWGSSIHLKVGEKLSLKEMLYGLLLNSGNDASIAIAEHIGGTVENFLKMMNAKAGQLGAQDTSFKSTHGLDREGHYSTAHDIAVITRYALNNPVFSDIVGTRYAAITNRNLHNTNEMLDIYPGADGVKTGYTGKAGRCLVTSVTRNDWRIISVVLNCSSRYKRAQSSKAILDYVFNNYKPYRLLKKGQQVAALPVIKGINEEVGLEAMENIVVPLNKNETDVLEIYIDLPDEMQAPVYENVEAGKIFYISNGEILGQSSLKTNSNIRKKNFFDYINDVVNVWSRMMKKGMFHGLETTS